MARISLAFLLCIVQLFSTSIAQPSFRDSVDCENEPENLSVGHTWLTDANYKKFKKENSKLFVLGVSDSSCTRCCATESMLKQLKEDFDAKVYTGRKGKKLQIARADVSEGHKWLRDEGLEAMQNSNDLPAIVIMHDGLFYRYQFDAVLSKDHNDVSALINFINRLQHPIVTLDTQEDVERFLDSDNEFVESAGFLRNKNAPLGANYDGLKLKTRVIAFIFDKDEHEQELKFVKEAGKILAQRVALRIGLVTDPILIRKYRSNYGTYWFPDSVQLSTIIV